MGGGVRGGRQRKTAGGRGKGEGARQCPAQLQRSPSPPGRCCPRPCGCCAASPAASRRRSPRSSSASTHTRTHTAIRRSRLAALQQSDTHQHRRLQVPHPPAHHKAAFQSPRPPTPSTGEPVRWTPAQTAHARQLASGTPPHLGLHLGLHLDLVYRLGAASPAPPSSCSQAGSGFHPQAGARTTLISILVHARKKQRHRAVSGVCCIYQ